MAIHDFKRSYTFQNIPKADAGGLEANPSLETHPPALEQSSHVGGRTPILWEAGRTRPVEVEEFLQDGFHYLDEAMKLYWSDIRIPTKDSYRFMRTKVAGASKTIQIWTDDLKHGRVELPVMSISRTGATFNTEKFSPPYLPINRRFVNKQRSRVAKIFRPEPWLVNYTLIVWSNWKRDAENALYQINTRLNPLAEFKVDDGHISGNVQLKDLIWADSSDKEATADQYAKVKYEFSMTAEAWLALPEQIVPTILGTVQVIKESSR